MTPQEIPREMHSEELDKQQLVSSLLQKAQLLSDDGRFMLGIIGYPGSGKTTAANFLVKAVNQRAKVDIAVAVPMDGFHRYNQQLKSMGLFELKGVPDSFDGQAFVALLQKLRKESHKKIGCPAFDRAIEEPTPDAIWVEPHHKVIVVEGNYLLLDSHPWDQAQALLDAVWFIDTPIDEIEPRLLERHIKGGRNEQAARAKMESTDLPNARLIEKTKKKADQLIKIDLKESDLVEHNN